MGDEGGFSVTGRPLLFVGGKGGVGKTTVASALALALADAGNRCLLVSTDPAHSLGDLFGRRVGPKGREIAPNLTALEIDPEAEADRYLGTVEHNLRDLVRPELYPEIARQLALARTAPGTMEAALLDRTTELMLAAGREYDVVVFDTAPVGHTLRLLSLPEVMAAWADGMLAGRDRSDAWTRALDRLRGGKPERGGTSEIAGDRPAARPAGPAAEDAPFMQESAVPELDERSGRIREVLLERRRRFGDARRMLTDPAVSGFLLVLVPETLPILESRKALDALRRFNVPVLGVVVNQVLPPEPLGEFLERRRERQTEYLARIEEAFHAMPRRDLPLLPEDVRGLDALRRIGALLTTDAEPSR